MKGSKSRYEKWTRSELLEELRRIEGAGPDAGENTRVLAELEVHRAELEAQNGALGEAQQLLEESRDRYVTLYDLAPVGYLTLDGQGIIREINLTASAILGTERARIRGFPLLNQIMPEDQGRYWAHLRRCREGERRTVTDLRIIPRGGAPLPVQLLSVPTSREGEGCVFLTLITDRSAEARREAEREQLVREHTRREEAERANRAKDEFLAMLAHELRNPLAPIRNAAQVIKTLQPQDPDLQWAAGVVERQIGHLGRLVDDLLDVSRITSGKIKLRKERTDLAAVVAQAVETSRPLIEGRKHRLEVRLPDEPVYLEADVTRMAQAVANLLNNAAKYTPEGGEIQLRAERGPSDGAAIHVRDSGMGIAPEMLPFVFDLFAQADRSMARSQGGLGIGLTLVRKLVEMHGGKVEAFSDGQGKGSEFVIHVPVLPGEPAGKAQPESAKARREGEGQGGARCKVLVVDDNVDSAETMAILLRVQGHEVRTAHDGQEALDVVHRFHPRAVVLDLGLPGINGLEVARRLRSEPDLDDVFLVALTGYGQEEDRQRTRAAGFQRHLVKPVDQGELEAMLTSLERTGPGGD